MDEHLVHKDNIAWALGRFLADTHSDEETEIIRTDSVSEYKNRSSQLRGRPRNKRESTTLNAPFHLNEFAERLLAILQVAELYTHICACHLFGDVQMPNWTNSIWAQSMYWSRIRCLGQRLPLTPTVRVPLRFGIVNRRGFKSRSFYGLTFTTRRRQRSPIPGVRHDFSGGEPRTIPGGRRVILMSRYVRI